MSFVFSDNDFKEDIPVVFTKENETLFDVDILQLYSNLTFHIQYGEHHYYGTYTLNNNNLELDINWNPFLPFRDHIPSKLKIIDGKKIGSHDKVGDLIIKLYF